MNRKKWISSLAAAAIATGAVGGIAYAMDGHDSSANEAAIIANAKISLSQAIAAAEGTTGGKAVDSGIEDQNGTVHFEVTVLKDGARQKLLVDTVSGEVVKTMADDDDNEHEDRDESDEKRQ